MTDPPFTYVVRFYFLSFSLGKKASLKIPIRFHISAMASLVSPVVSHFGNQLTNPFKDPPGLRNLCLIFRHSITLLNLITTNYIIFGQDQNLDIPHSRIY